MSDNTILYEVTETMNKYVEKINHAIQTHQTAVQQSPPKEIQLIKTLKLFTPQDNHHKMDKLVDMMLLMHTFQNIKTEFSNPNRTSGIAAASDSIHADGVYDVD